MDSKYEANKLIMAFMGISLEDYARQILAEYNQPDSTKEGELSAAQN